MEIKERIKQVRKSASLSQQELAKKLGISFMTIRRWESGEISPRLDEIQKISTVLNTPMEYLTGLVEEQKNNVNVIPSPRESSHDNNTPEQIPNMSYWGGVADNARNVAKYGNEADKADVCQMLKRALSALIQTTESPTNVDIHHNDISKASFSF